VTDQLDELHAQAALSILANSPPLIVFAGEVPAPYPGPRYVLVYTQVSWPDTGDANALDHLSVTCVVRWYCHCVGETEAAARAVGMQVRAALLNVRGTVAGRNCGLIRQVDSSPPGKDETLGTPAVFDAVSVYEMTSAPG